MSLACLAIVFFTVAAAAEAKPEISSARKDANGFLAHTVKSPFQSGTTKIRVLLPDRLDRSKRYPILFILPDESGDGNRYGDGLLEARKRGLHNKHSLICVAPTFSHVPWYADHPTDKEIRQETYFVKVVVPFVERTYPAIAKRDERLLVGLPKRPLQKLGACFVRPFARQSILQNRRNRILAQ